MKYPVYCRIQHIIQCNRFPVCTVCTTQSPNDPRSILPGVNWAADWDGQILRSHDLNIEFSCHLSTECGICQQLETLLLIWVMYELKKDKIFRTSFQPHSFSFTFKKKEFWFKYFYQLDVTYKHIRELSIFYLEGVSDCDGRRPFFLAWRIIQWLILYVNHAMTNMI